MYKFRKCTVINRNIRKEIIYIINAFNIVSILWHFSIIFPYSYLKKNNRDNFLNNNRNYILFVLDLSADHCAVFKLETNQLLYK